MTFPDDQLQPCGTPAAARRHYRRGEPLDAACQTADRVAAAIRQGRDPASAGRLSPDTRPARNGLPEFRPYQYRGLGYDQGPPGGSR